MKRQLRTYEISKRAFDIAASGAGLLVLSPVIATVAAVVRARLGKPVIFAQLRPGRNGKVFRLRKFRTMKPIDPANGLVNDEDRLTPLGQALRAASLDELPTLWNVLRGDMSMVGPRPLLVEYLDRYTATQARRHEVRPGVTGLAQVNGRNDISWDERLRLDVRYVDGRSWKMDIVILARTLAMVLRRAGIAARGHATMPEFMPEATDG